MIVTAKQRKLVSFLTGGIHWVERRNLEGEGRQEEVKKREEEKYAVRRVEERWSGDPHRTSTLGANFAGRAMGDKGSRGCLPKSGGRNW